MVECSDGVRRIAGWSKRNKWSTRNYEHFKNLGVIIHPHVTNTRLKTTHQKSDDVSSVEQRRCGNLFQSRSSIFFRLNLSCMVAMLCIFMKAVCIWGGRGSCFVIDQIGVLFYERKCLNAPLLTRHLL